MLKRRSSDFKSTTKFLFLRYAIIPNVIAFLLFSLLTILLLHFKVVYDTKQSAKNIEAKAQQIYDDYVAEIDRMRELPQTHDTLQTKRDNHIIYEEFYNFNNQYDVKSAFHLIDKRDVFLVTTAASNDDKIFRDFIPYIDKNPDAIYMNVNRTELKDGRDTVLNIGAAVRENGETVGYLVYQLYEEGFQDIIFGENTDIVVMTDDFDYIVATSNIVTIGLMNKFNPKMNSKSKVKIKDENYYLSEIKTKDNMFTIYAMNSTKKEPVLYLLFFMFIFVIGIIIYFLLMNMAEKMSTKNAESIEKLMVAVSKLKDGDTTAYVDISSEDEFGILANQYNDMLDSLNHLIQKNEQLSNVRNAIEMKLLESKFNPHFVFNILETLRYMMFVDKEKAQEIIYSLSRILRYSSDYHQAEVLFEKDLNYMLDYLKLHKYRFGERLKYDVQIEDAIQKAYVPKLLLQPLVENAIKYGYNNQSSLTIKITGKIIDDRIVFTVSDDGSGIDNERLTQIQAILKSTDLGTNEYGIGLFNAHRRIVLQYGNVYGLSIKSECKIGTEVTITIPHLRRRLID